MTIGKLHKDNEIYFQQNFGYNIQKKEETGNIKLKQKVWRASFKSSFLFLCGIFLIIQIHLDKWS